MINLFSWKISNEEIKRQVDNYDNLRITESFRGTSVLLILGSIILTIVLAIFNVISYSTLLYGVIMYLPIAYFIWRGHRWAIITAICLWTLDKGYQFFTVSSGYVPIIIWWVLFASCFYNTLRIENIRRLKIKIKDNKIENK